MRRKSVVVVFVTLCLISVSGASFVEGDGTRENLSAFRYLVERPSSDERQCGPYFALTVVPTGARREKRLIYFVENEQRSRFFPQERVITKLNKKRKTPSIQNTLIRGIDASVVRVGLTVELSPSDFDVARGCLPDPF